METIFKFSGVKCNKAKHRHSLEFKYTEFDSGWEAPPGHEGEHGIYVKMRDGDPGEIFFRAIVITMDEAREMGYLLLQMAGEEPLP